MELPNPENKSSLFLVAICMHVTVFDCGLLLTRGAIYIIKLFTKTVISQCNGCRSSAHQGEIVCVCVCVRLEWERVWGEGKGK